MKLIGWMLVLSVFFSSCSTYFQQLQQKFFSEEIAFLDGNQHNKGDSYPGTASSGDIWLEGIDDIPRRQVPYRRRRRKWCKHKNKEWRQHKKQRQVEKAEVGKTSEILSAKVEEESENQVEVTSANSGHSEEPTQEIVKKKRGRPANVPTNHVFCPNEGCPGYNQLGPHPNHRIVGAGTYETRRGEHRQMYRCEHCQKRFSETKRTVFFGLKTAEETVYRALASLAEGMGIRATARVFEVDKDTVLLWLKRAGEHCRQVSYYLMQNLHVDQVQLDELWTFVNKKEGKLSVWERLHTEYGDTWIWTAVDPVHKLVLAFLVGEREEEQAEGLLKRLFSVLVKGCLPLLTSDKLPHYAQASGFNRCVRAAEVAILNHASRRRTICTMPRFVSNTSKTEWCL